MISRFPKPRSQSANTTRPGATARTSCPAGERMNTPFHVGPPPERWAPKRLASSPLIGRRSPGLSPARAPAAPPGSNPVIPEALRRGSEQFSKLLDEPRQPRFVALQVFHLAALVPQLIGYPGEHLAVLRLLAHERGALASARRFDSGDLGVPSASARLELLQAREIGAQLLDESVLGAGNVAVVVQFACDATGLLAREKQFHAALLAVEVAQREQPSQGLPARGDFSFEGLASPGKGPELLVRCRASSRQRAQRPVGLRDRALGVAQLVADLGAAFLGLRDFRAHLLDPRPERIELLSLTLGKRQRRNEQETQPDPARKRHVLALPWSATARARASASAASPR